MSKEKLLPAGKEASRKKLIEEVASHGKPKQKITKKKMFVLDTNIILAGVENIKRLSQEGENIIVIPETVLLELEDKKKDLGELGFQAREFAQFADEEF